MQDKTEPARPTRSLATNRAYTELKRRIAANEMPPGTQYLEAELAATLGMSRTPIREACIRLAEEGMVSIKPRHGIRVLPVTASDMNEIYQILTSLEPLAARLVAEKVATGELNIKQLSELEDAVSAMDAALDNDDLNAWAEYDEAFHKLLVELSGNRRLQSVVGVFWDQAHRARLLTLRLRPKPSSSNRDHRDLVDALRKGDPEAAMRIHHAHRDNAGKLIVSILRDFGLSNV